MAEPATLPERAQAVDFDAAREEGSESWERATGDVADMDAHDEPGWWTVELPDGDDEHETFLAADREDSDLSDCWGWCECQGFAFNDLCAHIAQVRKFAVLNPNAVPPVDGEQDVDAEVVDMTEPDDRDDAALEDDQEDDELEPELDPSDVDDPQEFVEEISGVPPAFVVQMGHGKSAKPYITKEGLNYVAYQEGIETRAEPISPSWEDDPDVAAYRGIAVDEDGRRFEDVATAHAGQVKNTVGRENLDELASTRATNRALRLATGCGFASIEEVQDDPQLEPDPDADVDFEEGPA
jgi:hypothetical protein